MRARVQKEAYISGVPCITLRDTTEFSETVEEGWNILVGYDTKKIIEAVDRFNPTDSFGKKRRGAFGNGDSARTMANVLKNENVK